MPRNAMAAGGRVERAETDLPAPADPLYGLLPFRRLDDILRRALAVARVRFGPDAAADSFRGLYVSAEQAAEALGRPTGEPFGTGDAPAEPGWDAIVAAEPGWAWLRGSAGLSESELDVVLVALGPEVDLRYERLYGYLQDDVGRRRPTVDLALDLLTASAAHRLAARRLFAPDSALVGGKVLRLAADPRAVAPPLLAHQLVLDDGVVAALLGQHELPRACRWAPVASPSVADPDLAPLHRLVGGPGRPPRLYFRGPPGSGGLRAAEALAGGLGARLLVLNVAEVADAGFADMTSGALRAARRARAVLYVEAVDDLRAPGRAADRALLAERLTSHDGVVVLAGRHRWEPWGASLGVVTVEFGQTSPDERRDAWSRALGGRAVPADVELVADRFGLTHAEIEDAALTALTTARLRGERTAPTRADLFAAARAQRGHALAALTDKIEPSYGWDAIVLPDPATAQLHELCDRVAHRGQVHTEWGFDGVLSYGRGISALFCGPSGTGKTMAAEVVARELGLDLYKINLATVVSKYIGETEKNLERVFAAAADAEAILLFDEADALFGKRSDVRDAHDRYANIEVAYLLQRMERHDGLAILSTNLRKNLDEAFTRRLQFVVEFPVPDVAERRRIWEVCFPPEAPRHADIDLDRLAAGFRLAGGNIRNIVLAAAFRAAADGSSIRMAHLLAATAAEHRKMGRIPPPGEPDVP